jgi:hypothetical protein
MSEFKTVSEDSFREVFGTKLGQHLDRAVAVLNNFGPKLSFDVTNVMLHAVDKGKEDEVLTILEKHWEEHLQFQHPKIRGTVASVFGVNQTQQTFVRICEQTLALIPTAAAV